MSKIPHGGTILRERYLEALLEAEEFFIFAADHDLKEYFSFHLNFEHTAVDTWSIGAVRLEFEKSGNDF